MAEPEYLGCLQHVYDEWTRTRGGSVEAWVALFAPDGRLESPAGAPQGVPNAAFSGAATGTQGVRGFLLELLEAWTLERWEMRAFVVGEDRAVYRGHVVWRNKATGRALDTPLAHLWTFRDGLAIELVEFYDTAAACEAAG
jgi:ketosteroid isomerase-like protein